MTDEYRTYCGVCDARIFPEEDRDPIRYRCNACGIARKVRDIYRKQAQEEDNEDGKRNS